MMIFTIGLIVLIIVLIIINTKPPKDNYYKGTYI
jgi:uncharacterized integral membrane protein